ncbi:MAG: FkbM family methyltransferase [Phycisphaerales bacterium]|nr:FkbM family methyltransferase [Phycisphaerales bacterium]
MKAASQADRTFDTTNKWEDCKRLCRAPRVVLDCGANRGQAARNLREAYPHARLFCFEPVSSVIPHLEPVARELNAEIVEAAVSNRTGTAEINLTESHESNSLLGFLADNNPLEKYHRVRGTEQVRTWRLDDWCAQAGVAPAEVDVIKLDVQGAELMALDGATQILAHVRVVMLEVAFVPYYAACPLDTDVHAYMRARGFTRRHLYAAPMPEIWADAIYTPSAF